MKLRYLLPLVGFVVPTVVIGYGIVIPRSCIAGSTISPSASPRASSGRA